MLEHDGKLYYLTYLDVPQYGYICEDNLTDDEQAVVQEKKSLSAHRRTFA